MPPPVQPPNLPSLDPSPTASGIVAACAGAGSARIDYRLPGANFDAALFQGGSSAAVYSGGPVLTPLTGSSAILTGLTDGVDLFLGLAIRAAGSTVWVPVGATVRTRPGAPVYVDAGASAVGANGLTPQTAFVNLSDALLVAGSQNGRNVWVRDGVYGSGPYFIGPNVHCAGGFSAAFDLAGRDVLALATRATGSSSQEIFSVISGGADGSLDGFLVDGGAVVLKGVDIADSDAELRSLEVRNCADRGVKAAVTVATQNRRLKIIGCNVHSNVSDGVSTAGPYEIVLDLSNFDANGQEGIDVDNLEALDGGASSLRASGCRFFGNSSEGLDIDLSTVPGTPMTATGTFDVRVDNCRFELNGLDGLLIDQEYEFFPGFSATIVVQGCVARANRQAGVHIDADANGTYRLHRLRCTANAMDGLLITSETNASEIIVTSSWFAGNLSAGARLATGNKTVLASHCGFAGNQAGGMVSDSVPCAVANSVFLQQPVATTNAVALGNYVADGSAQVFERAPKAFTSVSANVAGALTVMTTSGFENGDRVRVADGETAFTIVTVAAGDIVLSEDPTLFLVPGMLQAYSTASVVDDLRLASASPASSVGITAPGEFAPDAGPYGAVDGGEPGGSDLFAGNTMRMISISPALAGGVAVLQPLVIAFDREVDVTTVVGGRVAVRKDGAAVVVGLSVAGSTITVAPPATGWTAGMTLQISLGLQAVDGSPLASALLVPITVL